MGAAKGDKEYLLPSRGLNSEANLLHFPQEFSPDLLNMEIAFNPQMVRPRKGMAKSSLQRLADTRNASDHDVGITSFLWEGVGGDPSLDFVVVQVAEFLYFFDASGLSDPSTAVHTELYDLSNALSGTTKGTQVLLEPARVVMANVKGKLLVTSQQIDPVIITWDTTAELLSPVILKLRIRDILGIEDGFRVDETVSSGAYNDDHKYNLLNQGWYKQRKSVAAGSLADPIAAYFTANGKYPSNAQVPWVGIVEDAGDLVFDPDWLKDQTFGSSPAARGHYVVDAFAIDRADVNSNPSVSGMSSGSSSSGPSVGRAVGGGVASGTDLLP